MRLLPDPNSIQMIQFPTIEEIEKEVEKMPPTPIHKTTPEEMLALADAMEFGTYRGTINLRTSWEQTIKSLREAAYEF